MKNRRDRSRGGRRQELLRIRRDRGTGNPTRRDTKEQGGRDGKKDRRIERGCRPGGEVVGTIAVTTLVAWYTLLVVHTHDPSPCLPRFPLSHSVSVSRPSSLDSFYTTRTCVSSRCKHRATLACTRVHACTHTRARSRGRVRALSPLFFSTSSLASRRRELHVLSSYSRSRLSTARESTHRDRAIY